MAWGIDRAALQRGRDEKAAQVAQDAWHHPLEQLARAHRWLDEEDEATRRFAEAAADLEESIEAAGRGDAASRGRTGGLLRMAGNGYAARGWFDRALKSGPVPGDEAALRYLLGDEQGALEAAQRAGESSPRLEAVAALARARLDRDPDAAVQSREILAGVIRAERTPPFEESGHPDLSVFDWLEEAFRVEAELRGEPVPDHAAMLERAGLAKAARGSKGSKGGKATPDWPPPPGRHELARTTPDGAEVGAVVAVDDDGDVELILDPREGIELTVRLIKEFGEYRVRIEYGDDEAGHAEQNLDARASGFRAACDAAADWLRSHAPDPPGGEWAAETLGALADAAFTGWPGRGVL
jgi:tetratricopeptide (TPR) repeat protein